MKGKKKSRHDRRTAGSGTLNQSEGSTGDPAATLMYVNLARLMPLAQNGDRYASASGWHVPVRGQAEKAKKKEEKKKKSINAVSKRDSVGSSRSCYSSHGYLDRQSISRSG